MNRKTYNLQRPVLSLLLFCSSFSPLLLVSKYVLLHSPLYTVACNHVSTCVTKKHVLFGPIKDQSFENQTSKFTRQLENVLAPLSIPSGENRSTSHPFKSSSIFAVGVSDAAISLFFLLKLLLFIWMPTQLSTDWKHWLTFCHSASATELCDFFIHDQMTKRGSCCVHLTLEEVPSSSFILALASLSLNFNACLFPSMNLSHALSNWRPLIGRETSLVFVTQYSSASPLEPDVETYLSAGDFKFNSVFCNCCVWRSSLFTLAGVLSRAIMFKTRGLLRPVLQSKWRSSSAAKYHADNVEVNPFFLNSPACCKRSQSISSIDFLSFILIFKTAKTKCPYALPPF